MKAKGKQELALFLQVYSTEGFVFCKVARAFIFCKPTVSSTERDIFMPDLGEIPGTAAISSLLSGASSNHFGRKKIIMASCIIEVIGCAVCATSFAKWQLLIGRIFLGLAIGTIFQIILQNNHNEQAF